MSISRIRAFAGAVALGLAALAASANAQTSGSNGSHDPSRMIESDSRVYIYSTGGGAKSSSDGLVWKDEATPPWNRNLVPNNQGIWAPDGIYLNGQYYLFGSMWAANKSSALVLLTSPTLNPATAHWTDRGVVVAGPAGVTHSCIDPAPVLDAQGNLWVVWGGGYPFATTADSIFVTRLDNATGLPLTADSAYKPPNSPGHAIAQGHKEGPYIHYHGGNYYLWYQTGSCCSGTASGYTMHVSRASEITGPYSGDRTFFASNSSLNIHGPGHLGIYACGESERFTYHYYPDNGSVIGENTLSWGSDGWPVAGARVTSGLKLPCAQTGGAGSGSGGAGNAGASTGGAAGIAGNGSTSAAAGGDLASNGGAPSGVDSAGSAGTGLSNAGAATAGSSGSPGGSGATAGLSDSSGGLGSAGEAGSPAEAGCACSAGRGRAHAAGAGFLLLALATAFTLRRRRGPA